MEVKKNETELLNETVLDVSPRHIQLLKNRFGCDNFSGCQWKIIQSIIYGKRDNFVIMPSETEKSICYQYPSVWTGGLTIVISPKTLLMTHQVSSFNQHNTTAVFLDSALDSTVQSNIKSNLINSKYYRLLYVCPEYIINNLSLVKQVKDKLTLIVIEEAHRLSEWGHDFRKEYQQLFKLREVVPNIPIMAVTTTASLCVQREVIENLLLVNPQITCSGFDRPNLEFAVRPKIQFFPTIKHLARTVSGSIIVYLWDGIKCEEFVRQLQKENFVCEHYHSLLEPTTRADIETRFRNNDVKLIFATSDFEITIEQPDIRYVIHYGSPRSIEQYYQEVCRAGNDGGKSKAIVFYEKGDVMEHIAAMKDDACVNEITLGCYMEQFLVSGRCRRLIILQYFQGLSATCQPRSGCCDNCNTGISSVHIYRYPDMDDKGFFDLTQDSRILMYSIDANPDGILKTKLLSCNKMLLHHRTESYWDGLIDVLQRLKFLNISEQLICHLSKLGIEWLYDISKSLKYQLQPFDKLTRFMETKTLTTTSIPRQEPDISDEFTGFTDTEALTTSTPRQEPDELTCTETKTLTATSIPRQEPAHESVLSPTNIKDHSVIVSAKRSVVPVIRLKKLNYLAVTTSVTATSVNNQIMVTEMKASSYADQVKVPSSSYIPTSVNNQIMVTEMEASSYGDQVKVPSSSYIPNSTISTIKTCKDSSLVSLIKSNPYPDAYKVSQMKDIHRKVMDLIELRISIPEIEKRLSLPRSVITDYVCTLLQHGYSITKRDLEWLYALFGNVFKFIELKLPDNVFANDTIRLVENQLPGISIDQIRLVISYQYPRVHLSMLGLKFEDPENECHYVPNTNGNIESPYQQVVRDVESSCRRVLIDVKCRESEKCSESFRESEKCSESFRESEKCSEGLPEHSDVCNTKVDTENLLSLSPLSSEEMKDSEEKDNENKDPIYFCEDDSIGVTERDDNYRIKLRNRGEKCPSYTFDDSSSDDSDPKPKRKKRI